jgi:hypothetical protein
MLIIFSSRQGAFYIDFLTGQYPASGTLHAAPKPVRGGLLMVPQKYDLSRLDRRREPWTHNAFGLGPDGELPYSPVALVHMLRNPQAPLVRDAKLGRPGKRDGWLNGR